MTQAPRPHRPLFAVLWMLLAGICFVSVTASVKLVGGGIPAFEAAFLRYALGLVFLIPMIRPLLRTKFDRKLIFMSGGRGFAHAIGISLWFFAMTRIPMAEVTAMNYMNPIYVTLAAALLMGERIAMRRIAAIGVSLIGALVILRPGFREISPGHIAMIFAAMCFAVSYLLAKIMSERIDASAVVALLSLTVPIGLAPLALAVWVTPTLTQVALLTLTAGMATMAHYSMTRAFREAPLSVTQPVAFAQLLWSAMIGAAVFGEALDAFVVTGGGLIIAAITFMVWREAAMNRRTTPLAGQTKL